MLDSDENENDFQTLRLLRKRGCGRDGGVLHKLKISDVEEQHRNFSPNLPILRKSPSNRKSLEIPVIKKWTSPRIRSISSSRMEKSDDSDISLTDSSVSPMSRIKHKILHIYGDIDGVKNGDWWSTRLECSYSGVHRPAFASVHAGTDGALSIVLTGCHDFNDKGFSFVYSGSGCRDLRVSKDNQKKVRTSNQYKSQIANGSNMSLMKSLESGNPVRVIRGYKFNSAFAPVRGYRYDGLYSVKKFWTCKEGASGLVVFKFLLKRFDDQPPAHWESEPNYSKSKISSITNSSLEINRTMDDANNQIQTNSSDSKYLRRSSVRERKSCDCAEDNKENSSLNIADRLLSYDDFTDSSILASTDNSLPGMNKRRLPRESETSQKLKKLCEQSVRNVRKLSSGSVTRDISNSPDVFKGFSAEFYSHKMILLGFLIHDMQCRLNDKQTV